MEREKAITSLIHVDCPRKENKRISSDCLATNSAADVENIETSIAFARTWISRWAARPKRGASLKYNHILALDYLACMLLGSYQPESEGSGHAQQLLTKIAKKAPGDSCRSVRVALEAKFVNWLRLGKPGHEYFIGRLMNTSVSDTD